MLAAIIAFATAALTLLAVGQFTGISDLAGALALGHRIRRHDACGLTVTERLRESQPARADRRSDRPGEPPPSRRAAADSDRSAAKRASSRCCSSTSTGSRSSTTRSAITPVTRSCARSARGSRARCASDDTLGRLGGDEFALVLAPGDETTASAAGLRLRRRSSGRSRSATSRSTSTRASASRCSPNTRATRRPPPARRRRDVRGQADAHRARGLPALARPPQPRAARARGRAARRARGRELVLHYQPKADLPDGAVHGVEALVRWQHPERGLLAPGHFLPLAEQSGLTRALTAFVLDRALEEMGLRPRHLPSPSTSARGPARLRPAGRGRQDARAPALRPRASDARGVGGPHRRRPGADARRPGQAAGPRRRCWPSTTSEPDSPRSSSPPARLDELKVDRAFVLGMSAARATPPSSPRRSTSGTGSGCGWLRRGRRPRRTGRR